MVFRSKFAFVFSCFCYRLVVTYFIINLLRWIIVSSIVILFVGCHIVSSNK